jgi:ribosome-binding factor A
MTQRTDRIDELLRQEIGQALEREVTDPRIGFVTVTDVETSPDLAHARVWVSVIGTPEQRKETMAALRGAMPYVRRGLNSKIRLRRIPELEVRLDDTAERGTRVMHILDELEAGHDPGEVGKPIESLPTPVPRLPHEGDTEEEPRPAPAPMPRRKPVRPKTGHPGDGRQRDRGRRR